MMRRLAIGLLTLLVLIGSAGMVEAAPLPQATSPCATAVAAALAQRGKQYVWGAKGPTAFDCSGLTSWAWRQAGYQIGLSTYDQVVSGQRTACTLGQLAGAATTCWQPGDLIFLRNGGNQHVALYVGNGLFADAYNPSTGVVVHQVELDPYYQANFWQARRVVTCDGAVVLDPLAPDLIDLGETASLEDIPNLLGTVTYQVPQCGTCDENGTWFLPPTEWDEAWPEGWAMLNLGETFRITISWLAWQIRELMRQLICWMFTMLQLLLDAAAAMINVIIAGLNALWKLLVVVWIGLRAWFYGFWEGLEWFRATLWGLLGYLELLWPILELIWQLVLFIGMLIADLIGLIWMLLSLALGFIGWIGGLALGFWLLLLAAFRGTSVPLQLSDSNPVYWMVRGGLEAIIASPIAWMYWLCVALIYIGFIYWMARFLSAGRAGGVES